MLVGLAGSALVREGKRRGLRVVGEAFADRGYNGDGSLMDRRLSGSLIDDADIVAARVLQLVRTGTISTHDGHDISIDAETVCIHGDTPGAVAFAKRIREVLAVEEVDVRAVRRDG
jgi:UPF0271 protein